MSLFFRSVRWSIVSILWKRTATDKKLSQIDEGASIISFGLPWKSEGHEKMAQFMDATSPRKLLKIYNLRTTNAMKMKLWTIVYLHETFHLTKDLGVTFREWQGVAVKPLKKAPKIGFLALFLGILRTIWKTVICVILCLVLHHWWNFFYKSDVIWGCNLRKTTQKQPKVPLFRATTNFENI